MRPEERCNIFRQEDVHWWYRSSQELFLSTIKGLLAQDPALQYILDAGCGTGGMIQALSKGLPGKKLFGIDISRQALSCCREKALGRLAQASIEALPFAGLSLDLVVSLDVLSDLRVRDERRGLNEICRVLKKGGYAILHLPAFKFLRGDHDLAAEVKERYTKGELYHKISSAGFEVLICSYRYMFLFPVLLLKRSSQRRRPDRGPRSDLKSAPGWLNHALLFVCRCENRLISHFSLPVGTSLFCLARKL
ncbi:class I SAM-dependent methyltransferase [Candidatus Omnitrophota bacterium]